MRLIICIAQKGQIRLKHDFDQVFTSLLSFKLNFKAFTFDLINGKI
jgi:hypothetical protein